MLVHRFFGYVAVDLEDDRQGIGVVPAAAAAHRNRSMLS